MVINKILFAYCHTCKESSYMGTAVSQMNKIGIKVDKINVHDYGGYDDSDYDCLIYKTFADESHRTKFINFQDLIFKADEKFHKFKGKKILLDSHDGEDLDGFARFNDKTTPRIKLTPSFNFMREYNVIATGTIRTWWTNIYKNEQKTIPIMYSSRKKHSLNNIRMVIDEKLK